MQDAASTAYSGGARSTGIPRPTYSSSGSTAGGGTGGAGGGPHPLPSLLVWPTQPFGVNTDLWWRLANAPCASVDPLLEKLNVYTPALPPYIAMTDVRVLFYPTINFPL